MQANVGRSPFVLLWESLVSEKNTVVWVLGSFLVEVFIVKADRSDLNDPYAAPKLRIGLRYLCISVCMCVMLLAGLKRHE